MRDEKSSEETLPITTYRDNTSVFRLKDLPENATDNRSSSIPKKRGFTIDEQVLLLLSLDREPIIGRILFTKEAFLLNHELVSNGLKVQNMKFVPYMYGPYSFVLTETINSMEYVGLIARKGIRGSRKESFELTDQGKKVGKEVLKMLSFISEDLVRKLGEKRVGWDQLGTDGILLFVYRNFQQFTDRSKLKEKFKPIDYGKGKG